MGKSILHGVNMTDEEIYEICVQYKYCYECPYHIDPYICSLYAGAQENDKA